MWALSFRKYMLVQEMVVQKDHPIDTLNNSL